MLIGIGSGLYPFREVTNDDDENCLECNNSTETLVSMHVLGQIRTKTGFSMDTSGVRKTSSGKKTDNSQLGCSPTGLGL